MGLGTGDGSDHGLSEKAAIEAFAELLTFDNVNSLNYLHAVITEVMRLYPPLPLVRPQHKYSQKIKNLVKILLAICSVLVRLWVNNMV
jgi:cytochrome P450